MIEKFSFQFIISRSTIYAAMSASVRLRVTMIKSFNMNSAKRIQQRYVEAGYES